MDGKPKMDYRPDFIDFEFWEFGISMYSHVLRVLDLPPKQYLDGPDRFIGLIP